MNNNILHELEAIKNAGICSFKNSVAPSLKEKAMLAYAFMHIKDFVDGDIEIKMSGNKPSTFIKTLSLPATFEEFWKQFDGAKSFHCRMFMPINGSWVYCRPIAIIAKGYDGIYDMMIGEGSVLVHGGADWSRKEVTDLCDNKLIPLYHKLKAGKPIPAMVFKNAPFDKLTHEDKLRTNKADANGKIHVRPRNEKDDVQGYPCIRNQFHFYCTDDIPCCGKCPLMEKAYNILLEVLDEESAENLKKTVEESGFLKNLGENGYHVCDKDASQCNAKNKCFTPARKAHQEICRYWAECFE